MSLTNRGQHPQDDPCPPWLISALQEVIFHSEVTAPVIATRMRVSVSLLYAWATPPGNRSGKHYHCPLYRAVDLTLASGNYTLLDALERQVGREIPEVMRPPVSLPEVLGRSAPADHKGYAGAMR